jgi:uncharacterized protein YggT (Ycf19 family)
MTTLIIAIIIFLELITYLIFFDIILSWLSVFWIKFRPKFVYDILEILYINVRKVIPTRIWYFDFAPMIILIIIFFILSLLQAFFPEIFIQIDSFNN